MVNFAALRDEAHKRLRRRGHEPFSNLEAMYISHRLALSCEVCKEPGEQDLDVADKHPLIRELVELIDVREIGKWEWLCAWLSYNHAAMKHTDAMSDIALYLLGMAKLPSEFLDRIRGAA